MLYSHDTTIRIHIYVKTQSTIMTNEHTSLEKYTSHILFSKGLCVRGELETEQTATYWPQVLLVIAILPPHSARLLNRGPEGPSPLLGAGSHCLELQLEHQLTDSNCGTGLYICLTPTCFLWVSHLHQTQPVHRSRLYLDVLDRMHLFLDWQLGRRSICYIYIYIYIY